MSRARELAKVGGKNQQVIAGLSSHVGVSTFLNNVHMFANLDVGGNVTVTGTTTFNGGTLTLGDANTDNIVFGGEVDSHIIPDDDGTYDLGSSTKEWKDLFIDGTAHIDTLDVDGNAGVIGNLTLTGNGDFNGNLDVDGTTNLDAVDIDGAVDMASTLTLAGNADFNGNLDVDGTTNLDAVDIDGAVDMASSLTLAGNADFNGNLDVDGTTNLDGTNIAGTLAVSGAATVDNLSLNGNTITTSSGNLTIDSNGGTTTIADNAVISGNLTVNGTTTTINSTTVQIDDKNFQVATGAADDAAADGAGFTVDSGDGDKTINFEATGDNWGFSENINLASGKVLKVNNTSILSSTTLGSSVVNSSLTTLGTISTGVWQGTAIGNAYLANSTMSVGGVTLTLGGTDATPAFNLSDATNYPTSSLTGTITNAQLAGSIEGTKLENSGVSAGSYGGSTAIPIITVDAQGLVTSASTTAIDSTTIENGSASVAVASNGPITSTGNHDFTAGIDVTGNITVTGTVDGADVASMNSKLSGIEAGATGDQTAAEIRTLVESATDSNVFTDADHSKLNGIEASATADQTASEILTLLKTVDGSGSGLDADTLDGLNSSQYLRSDTSDTFSGTLTVSGNILPNANGTRDLGANGTRWANVYSSDLDLSNQAKGGNSVDGTWGSYLIEEGEDHLFLTNRRSGKKFRFVLEEV